MKRLIVFAAVAFFGVSCQKEVFAPKAAATTSLEGNTSSGANSIVTTASDGSTTTSTDIVINPSKKTDNDRSTEGDNGGITDPNHDPSSNSKEKKRK